MFKLENSFDMTFDGHHEMQPAMGVVNARKFELGRPLRHNGPTSHLVLRF